MAVDLGSLMLQKNLVSQEQFRSARDHQMQKGGEIARICVDMGYVDDGRLAAALAQAAGVPKVDLAKVVPEPTALEKIPRSLASRVVAFPCVFRDGGRTLWIALANPFDEAGKQELQRVAGCAIKVTVAGFREIEGAIDRHYAWGEEEAFDVGGDDDGPIKITDMSGKTMVTMNPTLEKPPAPPPAAAPAPRAQGGWVLTEEDRRLVAVLQEGLAKSGAALQAVADLCMEKGLFSREQLAAKSGKR